MMKPIASIERLASIRATIISALNVPASWIITLKSYLFQPETEFAGLVELGGLVIRGDHAHALLVSEAMQGLFHEHKNLWLLCFHEPYLHRAQTLFSSMLRSATSAHLSAVDVRIRTSMVSLLLTC